MSVAQAFGVIYNISVIAFVSFIQPCNPISANQVPARNDWLHEPKLDGYRLQVAKQSRVMRLYSRHGHDWSKRLAGLADALRAIPAHSAVLDAELCFPGPDGAPDFFRLLKAAFRNQGRELAVYAFDLLHLNGQDLKPHPLGIAGSFLSGCSSGPMCPAFTWWTPSMTARSSLRRPSSMVLRAW